MVLDLYGPKILVIQIWERWAVSLVAALVVVLKVCLVCLVWLLVVGGGKGNDPERLGLGEPELQSCATNKYVLPLTWFSMEHCRKRPFWTVLFGNVRDLTHRKVQVALIFDCWRDGKIRRKVKLLGGSKN